MARQRKQKTKARETPREEDKIPEDEQWRIIEQTGLLKQIPREEHSASGSAPARREEEDQQELGSEDDPFSPFCNEIFNTTLFAMPFSSLYIMMDLLAHRQYGRLVTAGGILEKVVWGLPFLFLFIFYTLRYKEDRRMQAFLFVLSVLCGSRLIYIVNWASWKVVLKQCAPLGTIWVYTIAQLNLLPAVGALAVVAAYVKWKDLQIIM